MRQRTISCGILFAGILCHGSVFFVQLKSFIVVRMSVQIKGKFKNDKVQRLELAQRTSGYICGLNLQMIRKIQPGIEGSVIQCVCMVIPL